MRRLRLLALSLLAALAAPLASAQDAADDVQVAAPAATLLVYSRTGGWRHDSIDEAWAAIATIAHARGWSVTFTEDPAWFEADGLVQFDAVIWAQANGDTLSPSQKAAFRAFVENGGGYVGLHSAGDATHVWPWYAQELVGARFIGHPLNPGVRSGTIAVEDRAHPATAHLPARWHRVDEWYSFDRSVRGKFHVLATLDETTYVPGTWKDGVSLVMGEDHPIAWARCLAQGRSFYSALGHTEESYAEPAMRQHIEGGISWAMGEGDCPET
ncbi:ThuA domain-containing protein [Paraurantiacibacter namhicola]|uniref:Trehalose utilization n=1 Tax=Paraurantiacibacter namhicola TaxID=645517 RepID=A0A1C7D777_9SPHN|nr:ThuA domain-containing protein [Paraurantiacibacter namhicola]ANU07320.1 Trehalose utilization [Paraurantiacibacter namhicola]